MSSMSWFINYLYCWIVSSCILHKKLNKILQEPDWPFVSFWSLKSLYFISSHSLSFVLPLPVIGCHSLSLVITRCHSLSLDLSFVRCHLLPCVVTRCTTRCHLLYHSLLFVVIQSTTHCNSLSLVVTRCHSIYRLSVFL